MMKGYLLLLAFFLCFQTSKSQVKHHAWALNMDSRKPKMYEWAIQNDQSYHHRNSPDWIGLSYTQLKTRNAWSHGIKAEVSMFSYWMNYSFTRDISSGPIYYSIDRKFSGYAADFGYSVQRRLNTPKDSATIATGTFFSGHASLGLFTMKAKGYEDNVGYDQLISFKDFNGSAPYFDLYVGLIQQFRFSKSAPLLSASAGAVFFTSLDNGFYTQLNYRFGLGILIPSKIKYKPM